MSFLNGDYSNYALNQLHVIWRTYGVHIIMKSSSNSYWHNHLPVLYILEPEGAPKNLRVVPKTTDSVNVTWEVSRIYVPSVLFLPPAVVKHHIRITLSYICLVTLTEATHVPALFWGKTEDSHNVNMFIFTRGKFRDYAFKMSCVIAIFTI